VHEPPTAGGAAADGVAVGLVGVGVVAQPKSTPAPNPQQPAQKARRDGTGPRGRWSSEVFTGSVCHGPAPPTWRGSGGSVQKREYVVAHFGYDANLPRSIDMLRALTAAILLLATSNREGTRIAYLDLQRVMSETREGRDAQKRLESLRKSRQAELDKSSAELKTVREQIERQRLLLKPDALAAKEREFQEKFSTLQGTYLRLQQDLSTEEAKAMRRVLGKTHTLAEKIATREGFQLVLEKNNAGIIWANRSLDLTNEIVRDYEASPAAPR
jgi:outer membrane protein